MTKSRKEIEEKILRQEKIGEEEDYEDFARRQEASEKGKGRSRRGAKPHDPGDYNTYLREQEAAEEKTRKEGRPVAPAREPDADDYISYVKSYEESEARTRRQTHEESERQDREFKKREQEKAEERRRKAEEKELKKYAKRKKKSHPVRNFLLALIIVILAAGTGTFLYLRSLLQTVNPVELEESLQNSISEQVKADAQMKKYWNIALFGVDSRDGNLLSGDNRSDTIMICSIHKKSGEMKLVSVYRDTLLDIGGGDFRKCNAAYTYGGPQQAIAMLNSNLDLDITDFAAVGFEALIDAIDAFGGIDLEITEEERGHMNDYMSDMYDEIGRDYEEVTEAGLQHLSGIQATAYCRIRYTEGDDFKRAERQRTVLSLLMEKAKKAGPFAWIRAIRSVAPEIATSLGSTEMIRLGLLVLKTDLTDSTGFPSQEDMMFATVNGESCVIPYYLTTNVITLHADLFGQMDYEPSQTVEENKEIINSYVE